MMIKIFEGLLEVEQTWLEFWAAGFEYPTTIVADRYSGCYSNAAYLAFPVDFYKLPKDIDGGDIECMEIWKKANNDVIGKGATPGQALKDLRKKLKPYKEAGQKQFGEVD